VLVAAAYVVLWVAGVIWCALAVPQANTDGVDLSTATWATGIGIITLAALGVLGCSTWLARRGRWWVIGLLIAFVAGWFFALYLAAMFSVPVPAGEPDVQDDTAAVGLMYLFFPTIVVVAVLAGVGLGRVRTGSDRPCDAWQGWWALADRPA
jgi:hypothetical protein